MKTEQMIIMMMFVAIAGFLIGYVVRGRQGFIDTIPNTIPKHNESTKAPKEKIINVCRDVWGMIDGDSRWVLTQHCEDVIDKR